MVLDHPRPERSRGLSLARLARPRACAAHPRGECDISIGAKPVTFLFL